MKIISSTVLFLLILAIDCVAAGNVCIEAESAEKVSAPVIVAEAKEASGGKCLEIKQGAGNPPKMTNGEAVIKFHIEKAGDYIMWARVLWDDECSNSFTAEIDDSAAFAFGQDLTFKTWHWVKSPAKLKQLSLRAGPHNLTIKNREDGIKIDQVLFTSDSSFVPAGTEKPNQNITALATTGTNVTGKSEQK